MFQSWPHIASLLHMDMTHRWKCKDLILTPLMNIVESYASTHMKGKINVNRNMSVAAEYVPLSGSRKGVRSKNPVLTILMHP